MINFKELSTHKNMSFCDYLGLVGFSNSFFKFEKGGITAPIKPTAKMKFGSLVDDVLTDPAVADVAHPEFGTARKAAKKVIDFFGADNYENVTKQLSFTALMGDERRGFIPVKGRTDFVMSGVVADLKATEANYHQLPTLCKYMGYDKQLWFYTRQLGLDVNYGIILFYLKGKDILVPQKVIFDGSQQDYFNQKFIKFNI